MCISRTIFSLSRLHWAGLCVCPRILLLPPMLPKGMTTDTDPVYGPALKKTGLDRQPRVVPRPRTLGRHIRGLNEASRTRLDRVLLPILQRLARERPPEAGPVLLTPWEAVIQGRMRLLPEGRARLRHLNSCG